MKLAKRLLAVILALFVLFTLCACGGDSDGAKTDGNTDVSSQETDKDESSEEEKASTFDVTVVDATGSPVEGVMLQICKDSCIPARTDANGVASFNLEIDGEGYKLSVMSCPAGYQYTGDAEVYLEEGSTEYKLELSEAVTDEK